MVALAGCTINDGIDNDNQDFLAAAAEYFKLLSQGLTPEEAMDEIKCKYKWL